MLYKHFAIITFGLISAAFILLTGCQEQQGQQAWNTYKNDTYSYSIDYPPGWSLNEQFQDQMAVLKSPDGKVTISVLVSETNGRTLDQQVNFYTSSIRAGSFFYQVVSEKSVNFQGIDARQLMAAYQNNKDSPRYVSIELYMIEKGKAYLLRCTALEADLKSLSSDYQEVLSSFKLTN